MISMSQSRPAPLFTSPPQDAPSNARRRLRTRVLGAAFSTALFCGVGLMGGCEPAASTPGPKSASPEQSDPGDAVRPEDLGIDVDSLPVLESAETPADFDAAITELSTLHATVRDGFAQDNVDAVHGDLHDVGGLLEAVQDLVGDASLSEPDRKAVDASVETLLDAYMEVDATLHGQEGKEYTAVSEEIDSAMKTLVELQQKARK